MKVRNTPVEMVQVDVICEACNEGCYHATKLNHQGEIPTFDHACNHCGDVKIFKQKYPTLGHRPIGNPRTVELTLAEEQKL